MPRAVTMYSFCPATCSKFDTVGGTTTRHQLQCQLYEQMNILPNPKNKRKKSFIPHWEYLLIWLTRNSDLSEMTIVKTVVVYLFVLYCVIIRFPVLPLLCLHQHPGFKWGNRNQYTFKARWAFGWQPHFGHLAELFCICTETEIFPKADFIALFRSPFYTLPKQLTLWMRLSEPSNWLESRFVLF